MESDEYCEVMLRYRRKRILYQHLIMEGEKLWPGVCTREQYFVDGIMNAEYYYNILKENMLSSLKWLMKNCVFQHKKNERM